MSRANMRILIMQNAAALNEQQEAPNQGAPGAPVQPGPNPAASRINRMQEVADANAAAIAVLESEEEEVEEEAEEAEEEDEEEAEEVEIEEESSSVDADWIAAATKKDLMAHLIENKEGFDPSARHIVRARRAELVSLVEDL